MQVLRTCTASFFPLRLLPALIRVIRFAPHCLGAATFASRSGVRGVAPRQALKGHTASGARSPQTQHGQKDKSARSRKKGGSSNTERKHSRGSGGGGLAPVRGLAAFIPRPSRLSPRDEATSHHAQRSDQPWVPQRTARPQGSPSATNQRSSPRTGPRDNTSLSNRTRHQTQISAAAATGTRPSSTAAPVRAPAPWSPLPASHRQNGNRQPSPRRESSALRTSRVALRKRFGQHLLRSPDVVRNIVAAANLKPTETVFEIGPGTGNLTMHLLAAAATVYAAELDDRLFEVLRSRVEKAGLAHKLQAVRADFLRVPLPPFDALVANIPYQISSPVLTRLFSHRPLPSRAIIMFQKEFGERIVAAPGTSAYCRLSVNTRLLALSSRIVMRIGRDQFRPPPKVDSVVVEIVPRPEGAPADLDFAQWDAFLRVCFGSKNKTLRSLLGTKNVVAALTVLRWQQQQQPQLVEKITAVHQLSPPAAVAPVFIFDNDTRGDNDIDGGDAAMEVAGDDSDGGALDSELDAAVEKDVVGLSSETSKVYGSGSGGGGLLDNLPALRRAARGFNDGRLGDTPSAQVKTAVGTVDRAALLAARDEILSIVHAAGGADRRPNAMAAVDLLAVFRGLSAAGFRFLPIQQREPKSDADHVATTAETTAAVV